MRIGVGMTVNDRPPLLGATLNSWAKVRFVTHVEFLFRIEPGWNQSLQANAITRWAVRNGVDATITLNQSKYGSQENPYQTLKHLFAVGCDYAILAEDDLLVSSNILEYHRWASEKFKVQIGEPSEVAMVCSFNELSGNAEEVFVVPRFASVWVWGTWRNWWDRLIEPTWDHNYSNGEGFEKGWDHHLDKRVIRVIGLKSAQPARSLVQNIGVHGTHSTPSEFVEAPDWEQDRVPSDWYVSR